MSTTQKLARYETALEIYNMMIAQRAAAIAKERVMSPPNQTRIDALLREQADLRSESNALDFNAPETLERVIAVHGKTIKAANARLGLNSQLAQTTAQNG